MLKKKTKESRDQIQMWSIDDVVPKGHMYHLSHLLQMVAPS